jgi:chromosome segregation ATPase
MKKLTIVAAALLALTACNKSNDETIALQGDNQALRDSLQQTLADQDSLLVLLNEINDGMTNIKLLEQDLMRSDLDTESTTNRRQQIRNDMEALQKMIVSRKARLAELEARLNKSNSNNETLRRAVASLKSQIADQVSTIETLRNELASANIHIDRLVASNDSLTTTVETTIKERNTVIQENIDLTNELNICYYAVGSKKELKEQKIIESGFLRKTKIMPEDFNHNYFTVSDKRTLKSIPLHSKKAEVMTNQPSDSYTITEDASGMKTLNITNSTKFWGTSNYIVVKID